MTSDAPAQPIQLSVLATVLTYNSAKSLVDCIRQIGSQTHPPDAVLVIDNASVESAANVLAASGLALPGIEVLRLEENGGPAGGHAAGLQRFLASEYDLAWVMDDDCLPEPTCLEALVGEAHRLDRTPFIFPRWVQPDGTVTYYPAWCGFIVGRQIVEEVGLPIADFFWWAEDTEYLFWRIPKAGYPLIHAKHATVHHTNVRQTFGNPPWKYYYEARNNVYFHLYLKRSSRRLLRKLTLTVARAAFRESDGRVERILMIGRGIVDGLLGRLGQRVPVDRTWAADADSAVLPATGSD